MKLVRLVSSGEYSDYNIHGLLVVGCADGKEWLDRTLAKFLELHPLETDVSVHIGWNANLVSFYKFILEQPEVSTVEFEEWHIGAYNELVASVR